MANFAPILLNFNGGEVSPRLRGRVDHEKYPSWAQEMENFILTPQGMMAKRGGSCFIQKAIADDFASEIIPFEYSETETYLIEFGKTFCRFYTNDGVILTGSQQSGTLTSATAVTLTTHGYSVNEHLYIGGMTGNDNGRIVKVATVPDANSFTIDTTLDVSSGNIDVQEVYELAHPYTSTDLAKIQYEQSGNRIWLFHSDYATRVLTRSSNTSWAFSEHAYDNGPWLPVNSGATRLQLSARGCLSVGATLTTSAGSASNAWDGDPTTAWDPSTAGTSNVKLDLGVGNSAQIIGYWICGAEQDYDQSSPGHWTLEGSDDNSTWIIIDRQMVAEAWLISEYRFFSVPLSDAFRYFRFKVERGYDQDVNMRAGDFSILAHPDYGGATLTLTASSTTDINDGNGFNANDVGRRIRLLSLSGFWIWGEITAYTSTTSVDMVLWDYPATSDMVSSEITTFQLGVYSDQTRHPDAGHFFQNRLVTVGGEPPRLEASSTDAYSTFSPSDPLGLVSDDNAISALVTTRKADGVVWISGSSKGIVVGGKSGEWVFRQASTDSVLGPANILAQEVTQYGSKPGLRPQNADNAILFADKTGRHVRELAYIFEDDSFRSPTLNLLTEHLFTKTNQITAMAYQRTPQSILWVAREDGQLCSLSYNRENDIVGWSRHILGGVGDASGNPPVVEKLMVITNPDGDSDALYMVVKRYIDGATVRYIERLSDEFTDDTAIEDAVFVDSCATYDSTAATTIGNLWHLEGEAVSVLADGEEVTGKTVSSGSITLSTAASTVHIGYGIDSRYKSLPIRGGAMDGTAQGRRRRVYEITFDLWKSQGGVFGRNDSDLDYINYDDTALYTGYKGPYLWPGEHNQEAQVVVEHTEPLPFNVRQILPRVALTDM